MIIRYSVITELKWVKADGFRIHKDKYFFLKRGRERIEKRKGYLEKEIKSASFERLSSA